MSQTLPWYSDNPNEGKEANYVQIINHISQNVPLLIDVTSTRVAYSLCSVNKVSK